MRQQRVMDKLQFVGGFTDPERQSEKINVGALPLRFGFGDTVAGDQRLWRRSRWR